MSDTSAERAEILAHSLEVFGGRSGVKDQAAAALRALAAERDALQAQLAEANRALAEWADVSQRNYQRAKALEEALTPSGDTKAAYSGEFYISVYCGLDEDEDEIWRDVPVDWTTIKAIMATIKARATLAKIGGGDG
jgi:hypothetical protein